LDQVDTEEMLLACGLLAASDRDNHRAVERALSHFLSLCYRNAFQHDEEICDSVRQELRVSTLRKVSDGPKPKPKQFR
jgi:hypothetical protein